MNIYKEIACAVKRIAAFDIQSRKASEELAEIISNVTTSLKSGNFDFGKCTSLILKQNGKKRRVKRYEDIYSTENVLCLCIKQILDKAFKIKYPNRNKTMKELFSILPTAVQMSDFTIIKFDFEDYFNSVSAEYVFEKYIRLKLHDRVISGLVKCYVDSTHYAYAGLCTSNAIAEIIASYFDEAIRETFASKGVIYYQRYIDDSFLILNEHIESSEIEAILKNIIADIFHDRNITCHAICKTRLNDQKYKYISKRSIKAQGISVIDFLGYEFNFLLDTKNRVKIKYGITEAKRLKYTAKLDKIISCFTNFNSPDYNNLELLRHRVAAFSSRVVYITKRFRSNIWNVRGFISNYGELRYLLDDTLIEKNTEAFLKNMINEAFDKAHVQRPYFLMNGSLGCGYNLYQNMKQNKTLVLVRNIGYDNKSIIALCKKIGINEIDANGKHRGYGSLVRDYLIKVKIGY